MTPRQGRLLAFIRDYIREVGYGPCVKEMMPTFGGNSVQGLVNALDALEGEGLIRRLYGKARAIEVCAPRMAFLPVATDASGNAFIDASKAQPLAPVD